MLLRTCPNATLQNERTLFMNKISGTLFRETVASGCINALRSSNVTFDVTWRVVSEGVVEIEQCIVIIFHFEIEQASVYVNFLAQAVVQQQHYTVALQCLQRSCDRNSWYKGYRRLFDLLVLFDGVQTDGLVEEGLRASTVNVDRLLQILQSVLKVAWQKLEGTPAKTQKFPSIIVWGLNGNLTYRDKLWDSVW